jgi:hypothetical protein
MFRTTVRVMKDAGNRVATLIGQGLQDPPHGNPRLKSPLATGEAVSWQSDRPSLQADRSWDVVEV